MPDTEKLKPCPFCGGEPYVHESDWSEPPTYSVHCGCGSMMHGHTDRAVTVENWNKRTGSFDRSKERVS